LPETDGSLTIREDDDRDHCAVMEHKRDLVVNVEGEDFAAIDYGGDGPDVLLIHQLASNALVWAPLIPELTKVAHVVAVDLRAHGLSRLPAPDPARISADVASLAAALGLNRPVLLVEQDEILALDPDRLAGVDAPVLGLLSVVTTLRGEEAHLEWAEQVGPEALHVWDERFGIFASGRDEELESYLDDIVARSREDWVSQRIDAAQYRAFYERQIEKTPQGWRRRPTRAEMEAAAELIGTEPHGLDLLDTYPGPLWLLSSDEACTDVEEDTLRAYTDGRPDREFRLIPGGPTVEALDPEALAQAVAEMLRRHVG